MNKVATCWVTTFQLTSEEPFLASPLGGAFLLERAMLESFFDWLRRFFFADDDASRHGKVKSLLDLLSFPTVATIVCGITYVVGLLTGATQ